MCILVLSVVSVFGLYGERFSSEGLGWIGCWGCCDVTLCIFPLEFRVGITFICYVIWVYVCVVGRVGWDGSTW